MTRQLQNFTVQIADMMFDGLARVEQRPDRSDQVVTDEQGNEVAEVPIGKAAN